MAAMSSLINAARKQAMCLGSATIKTIMSFDPAGTLAARFIVGLSAWRIPHARASLRKISRSARCASHLAKWLSYSS